MMLKLKVVPIIHFVSRTLKEKGPIGALSILLLTRECVITLTYKNKEETYLQPAKF
jgi:hypothetical protein